MNKARPDINLLAVFDAVAETRSVTHAAARLSLSQPAVSHALNRLRDLLQDPLFVRGRSGLIATPRAEAMITPVRGILAAAEAVFARAAFDAATTEQSFRIAASDYAMTTVVPGLVRALRASAPLAALEIHPASGSLLAQLETGEIDASFWGGDVPPPPFRHQTLFEEHFAGLLCGRHPLAVRARRVRLSLDDYLAHPHVMVSFRDPRQSPIDACLHAMGRVRRKGITTPNFAANLAALPGTDLIMSLPSRLAMHVDTRVLVPFDLPIDVPTYPYSLVWHRRTDTDAALAWFRRLVLEQAVGGPG